MLYILDEISIKKSGIPFLNLDYQVWKFGPVSKELFVELSSSPSMLKDFIERKYSEDGISFIPKKEFSDDEFTDNEIELLKSVAVKFRDATAQDLVSITHREQSPWYNAAVRNSVLELLLREEISSTDIPVNMKELIEYDHRKLEIYEGFSESF